MATAEAVAIKQLQATERQTEVLAGIAARLDAIEQAQAEALARLDAQGKKARPRAADAE